MTKTFKKLVAVFALLLGGLFLSDTNVVSAGTLISQEKRDEFANKDNMVAFDIDFNEESGKYRLKHNNGSSGWYSDHDTLQDLLDSVNSSAGSYLSGNDWDIHLEFTETVPLNETITFRKKTEWSSYKNLNFYVTSTTGGTIFDVVENTGAFSWGGQASYQSVETASGSIVADGTNTFMSVYFYDCTINGLVSLEQKNNANIYLDNTNLYFLSYTVRIDDNTFISPSANFVTLGDPVNVSDEFKVLNNSTLGLYELKFCNDSVCDTFGRGRIENEATLTLGDNDSATIETIDLNGGFLENNDSIIVEENIHWMVNSYDPIKLLIEEGTIYFYDEIKIYQEDRLLEEFEIHITIADTDSIHAYNFTSNYVYKVYHDTYYEGFVYARGDSESLHNFVAVSSVLEERAHPNDETAPLIARTVISEDVEEENHVLGLVFDYYKWTVMSNKSLNTYTGYVEKGKSINDSIYISSDNISDSLFYDFEGSQYYELYNYYLNNEIIELSSFIEWVPSDCDQSLMYMLGARKYYFEFDEESLYGAIPRDSYITYEDIDKKYTFSLTFKDYSNFDENARALIGWALTSDGETLTYFYPTAQMFENARLEEDKTYIGITLYARYNAKYEVKYIVDGVTGWEEVVRYIEQGYQAPSFENSLPVRGEDQFLYWYDVTNPTEAFDFNTPITKEYIFRAEWRNLYTLTLTSQDDIEWYEDGSRIFPSENKYVYKYYEEEIGLNSHNITIVREDYEFQYWYYLVGDTEVRWNFDTTLDGNKVLYPKWKIEQYTVHFSKGFIQNNEEDVDKFTNFPESIVVDKYTYITEPEFTESVEDYEFDYWRDSSDEYYERFDFETTQVTRDIYLVIQWANVEYAIEWIIKSPVDGTDIEMTSECLSNWDAFSTARIGSTLTLPMNCIDEEDYPEDYVFAGWSEEENADSNEVIFTIYADQLSHNYRNFKFYAVWAKVYEVTFTVGNAQDDEWYWCDPSATCDSGSWDGELNETQVLKVIRYGYATEKFTLKYIGHTVIYWYENDDKVPFDFANTKITKDTTLHPYFDLENVHLVFVLDENDEKSIANEEIWPEGLVTKYGEIFVAPSVELLYEHYAFIGWKEDGATTLFDWQAPAYRLATVELYPVWEPVKYSWSYVLTTPDSDEPTLTGSFINKVDITMLGDEKSLPTIENIVNLPAKWKFIGWYDAKVSSGTVWTNLYVNNETLTDLVLYAQYEFRTIEVRYQLGEQVENETYCLEHKDGFGTYHIGDVDHLESGIPCNYMTYTFDSESDDLTIANPKNMYVIDGIYYVSGWKLGTDDLEAGDRLTYQEALMHRNMNDVVTITPILTQASFKPEVSIYDDEIAANEITSFYIQNKTNKVYEYLFVFSVSNGQYSLIGKTTTDEQGYVDLMIVGEAFEVGKNNLVAIYVFNQELDLESIADYASLGDFYKFKYEFTLTLTVGLINPNSIVVPEFTYNGELQYPYVGNTILPNGVTITAIPEVDAGEYTARVSINNTKYYAWSDNSTSDKTIRWTIQRKNITTKSGLGEYVAEYDYDGNVREITISMILDEQLQEDDYELSHVYKTSEGGLHRFELNIKKNYTIDGMYDKEFYWKINPRVIGVPYRKDGQGSFKTENTLSNMSYELGKEEFTLYDFVDHQYLDNLGEGILKLIGDTTYMGVGTYNLAIVIENSSNYVWTNHYIFSPDAIPPLSRTEEANITFDVVKVVVNYPKVVGADDSEYTLNHIQTLSYVDYNEEKTHTYIVDGESEYYTVEGTIEGVKNIGTYTITIIPVDAQNMCWSDYDHCQDSSARASDLTFKLIINPGVKFAAINAYAQNGYLWFETIGFEEEEVAYITFINDADRGLTSIPKPYLDITRGMNQFTYTISWINDNYNATQGMFAFEWDGEAFRFEDSIFNHLTPPVIDDDTDEDNNDNDSDNDNSSQDEGTSTGCSKGEKGQAYGDLIAMLSVLGLVFLKKKKLF